MDPGKKYYETYIYIYGCSEKGKSATKMFNYSKSKNVTRRRKEKHNNLNYCAFTFCSAAIFYICIF